MSDLRTAAQKALEALYEETAWFGPTPKGAAAIAALKAVLAQQAESPCACWPSQMCSRQAQEPDDIKKQLANALDSAEFYRRRCEALQSWQSKMRDPERIIVCDILANGKTLDPAFAGDRYTAPPQQAEPVQEPVAWYQKRGQEVLTSHPACWGREDEPWTPLYTAPPQRKPLTEEEIRRICDEHWSLRQLARAIERAHGIKE